MRRDYVPTVIAYEEVLNSQADEDILLIVFGALEQLLPGFLLIDGFEWPLTPANARLRIGVHS